MKLAQMKRTTGEDQGWAKPVADKTGREDYELTIRGPKALVSKVFEKSDAEIEIDPHASDEIAQKRIAELGKAFGVLRARLLLRKSVQLFARTLQPG